MMRAVFSEEPSDLSLFSGQFAPVTVSESDQSPQTARTEVTYPMLHSLLVLTDLRWGWSKD